MGICTFRSAVNDTLNSDNSRSKLRSNMKASYFLYMNKERYQGNHTVSIQGAIRLNQNEQENYSQQKEDNNNSSLFLSSENRFYFGNLFYAEYTVWGVLSYYNYETENKYYTNNQLSSYLSETNLSNGYHVNLPLSLGKGRIEPVEDARQALYILKELRTNNRLKQEPTNEEIQQLSTNISKIKNERVLDSRLKKIYELHQLDSILISMDLLAENDVTYFAALNDMWDFGGLPQRGAGYRLSLRYMPVYNFDKLNYKTEDVDYLNNTSDITENKSKWNNFRNLAGIHFVWEKPIKQKFQSFLSGSIDYSFSNMKYEIEDIQPTAGNNNSVTNEDAISGIIVYRFGIYPNTRTYFFAGVTLQGTKYWTKEDPEQVPAFKYESYNYGSIFHASLYYYISPKLRLNLTYGFINDNENNQSNKQEFISHGANVSLLYSIF